MADDEYLLATIGGPLGEDMADLDSLRRDMARVRDLTALLLGDTNEAQSRSIRSALWESAVVTYGRCFGTGKSTQGGARMKVHTDAVQQLPEALRAAHEMILEERN